MNKDMGNLITKMMGAMGQDPKDLLTEKQINEVLEQTFIKFDNDGSGILERPEFHKAWEFLGLDGSREEVDGAFDSVDSDKSGMIDKNEFMFAVTSNRMADLSLNVILTQMDGKLEGLQGIFDEYKIKLEQSRKEAEERMANAEGQFLNFQATARRRRVLKKKMEEQIAIQMRTIVRKLKTLNGDTLADEEGEEFKFYQQLQDTFNAFDRDGNAELQFPEYTEAWNFLSLPGGPQAIKSAFDSVDVDRSGLVEWNEFVFSIMGEKAIKYGVLADMEALTGLLDTTAKEYTILKETLSEVRENNDQRATRNKQLRDRLETMKADVSSDLNSLLTDLLGMDPRDVLKPEEIDAHLKDAFNKFDEDNSGQLQRWEFTQAWFFLGLKGSEEEINKAFRDVDTNRSGEVDLGEFMRAIKSERMEELNLKHVLGKMGVQLNNLDGQYDRFKATEQRRRLLKKKWEENIGHLTKKIITKLSIVTSTPVPEKNPEKEKLYNTLKDTFNAFDTDGSAELGFDEYMDSWKFLNRPGDHNEIKRCFDSVDVDGSGRVEWSEYAFSMMGEDALQFGAMADLETLDSLITDADALLSNLQSANSEATENNALRAERNAELRARMAQMKKEMGGKLGSVIGKMMSIMGQNPEDLLTEKQIQRLLTATFQKFDRDNSGVLENEEFHKAWAFLKLQGESAEVDRAFREVDTDGSGKIDVDEFCKAIKGSRMAEMSLSVIVENMDGHLEGLEDLFATYKSKLEEAQRAAADQLKANQNQFMSYQTTARKRRALKKKYMEDISTMTRTIVDKLAPEVAAQQNSEERDLFFTLKDTFNAFDRDGNAEMQYPEYSEAWKFLGQPGDEVAIKRAFDSVDVDGSGLVEWDEFVFSIMGEAALKYGLLADMSVLTEKLDGVMMEIVTLKDSLSEIQGNADERAKRNANLRARLENVRGEVSSQMNELLGQLMGINPEDVLTDEEINAHLKSAFDKFDEDNSGQLGEWEFTQAWFFLGLKGNSEEISDAFKGVDTNNSGLVDLQEFQKGN